MKASDLRIGNWIKYKGYPMRIVSICADDWVGIDAGGAGCIEVGTKDIRPIPLKKHLVSKLDEDIKEPVVVGLFDKNDKIRFEYVDNRLLMAPRLNEERYEFGKHIRYVHEFQNLYQALFGKDVKIKEEWL